MHHQYGRWTFNNPSYAIIVSTDFPRKTRSITSSAWCSPCLHAVHEYMHKTKRLCAGAITTKSVNRIHPNRAIRYVLPENSSLAPERIVGMHRNQSSVSLTQKKGNKQLILNYPHKKKNLSTLIFSSKCNTSKRFQHRIAIFDAPYCTAAWLLQCRIIDIYYQLVPGHACASDTGRSPYAGCLFNTSKLYSI